MKNAEQGIEQMQGRVGQKFPGAEELAKKRADLQRVQAELQAQGRPNQQGGQANIGPQFSVAPEGKSDYNVAQHESVRNLPPDDRAAASHFRTEVIERRFGLQARSFGRPRNLCDTVSNPRLRSFGAAIAEWETVFDSNVSIVVTDKRLPPKPASNSSDTE